MDPNAVRDLLASKWLSLKAIQDLAQEHNFSYRKGKFNLEETTIIDDALNAYRISHDLTPEQLTGLIFSKRGPASTSERSEDFWPTIAGALGSRPVLAVYNYVRRISNPDHAKGKWSPEEDTALSTAVAENGRAWEKIGNIVGRTGGDCKDRWTHFLDSKGVASHGKNNGKWTVEEEDRLRDLVDEFGPKWKLVATKLGSRSDTQCRIKWRDDLYRKDAAEESKGWRWDKIYRSNLVHAVAAQDASDLSAVEWSALIDPVLKPHGPRQLRAFWRTLSKEAVEAGARSGHRAEVNYLLKRYPELGKYTSKKRKVRPDENGNIQQSRKGKRKHPQSSVKSEQFVCDADL